MKRIVKTALAATITAALTSLTGCGTTSNVSSAATTSADKKAVEASVKVAPESKVDEFAVVDWFGRALDEPAAPTWLKNLSRGNADVFKQEKKMDNTRIVKLSSATGRTAEEAQAFSRAGFAYSQAAELNQKVIGRVGQGLNDDGQLEALYVAASETKAKMAGLREELYFWQKVRTTNKVSGESKEYYIGYTAYSMDKTTWDDICQGYLLEIIANKNLTSETKKKVGDLFSEMKEDADKMDAQKAADEKKLYDAQMARLSAKEAEANAETAKAKADAANSEAQAAKANAQAAKASKEEAEAKARAEEARAFAEYMEYLR